jgi:hypothetical protein
MEMPAKEVSRVKMGKKSDSSHSPENNFIVIFQRKSHSIAQALLSLDHFDINSR